MTKQDRQQRGPGRPPIYDPVVIQGLLSEREHTGETYVELEARSGIPAGTLSSWSRRQVAKAVPRSAFVEVVVTNDDRERQDGGAFEIVIAPSGGSRRVVVAPGFDAAELQRLVEALEGRC